MDRGLDGMLPETAKWILLTQLTFLSKPASDTPRPIRCGDHLRRMVGKRLLIKFGGRIRRLMLKMLQFGVAMPGGGEALIHARATVEDMAGLGQLGAIAIVDVDLVNCFGMFEWPATLAAVDEMLPEISPWVR